MVFFKSSIIVLGLNTIYEYINVITIFTIIKFKKVLSKIYNRVVYNDKNIFPIIILFLKYVLLVK